MNNKNDLTAALAHCLEALEREDMSFQDCLDHYPQHREELTTLLGKFDLVRSLPLETARAEFRKKGHQALLNAIKDRQPETIANRLGTFFQNLGIRRQGKLKPVGVVAGAFLAFLLVTGGVAYASDAAVPGDLLYGLDRAIERVQLNLAANPEAAVALHLANVEERLAELEDQVAAGDIEDAHEALANYGQEIAALAELVGGLEGIDASAQMELIYTALAVHRDMLTGVMDKVPEQAQEAIQHAIDSAEIPLDDIPGAPGEAEKPEDAGKPEEIELPEDAGKPEEIELPDDAGKPEEIELPDGNGPPDGVNPPTRGGKP